MLKLSHIVIILDETIEKEDICAFCTNIRCESPEIRFTYYSYDNLIAQETYQLFTKDDFAREELFVITDSNEVISFINERNIAGAGLFTKKNRSAGLSGVLYCIEDIEYTDYSTVLRIWQRFHGIAWKIAETKRLIIREQTMEDIDALYEIYADPEISLYTENLYEDKDEERKYLREYIDNQYKYYEYGIWALVDKKSGALIGRAGLSLREGFHNLELGFVIGKKYQRQGYGYEACSKIIDYAFNELSENKLMALCHRKNKASLGLLKKLGFKAAGVQGKMVYAKLTK